MCVKIVIISSNDCGVGHVDQEKIQEDNDTTVFFYSDNFGFYAASDAPFVPDLASLQKNK